jgi:hypothetical protein
MSQPPESSFVRARHTALVYPGRVRGRSTAGTTATSDLLVFLAAQSPETRPVAVLTSIPSDVPYLFLWIEFNRHHLSFFLSSSVMRRISFSSWIFIRQRRRWLSHPRLYQFLHLAVMRF